MDARMSSVRLRTKFLLSFLLVSAGLTSATLWMVHRSVRIQLQKEIANDLRNSVTVFQDFQRQREVTLARSAEARAARARAAADSRSFRKGAAAGVAPRVRIA